jgi:hypothetical protein
MKRGFMDFAATRIIPDRPGETAEYYAKEYLESAGKDGSDAQNPVQSLANTLRKRVGTGGEKRVRRERVGGVYRYFPVGPRPLGTDSEYKDIAIQISLSAGELRILDDFVAVGHFNSRSHVLAWLVREGVKARSIDVEKVAEIRKKIDELKGSIPPL